MAQRTLLDTAVRKLRDPQTPTWWSAAQVVVGVIFVALFAVALLTNDDPSPVVAGSDSSRTGTAPTGGTSTTSEPTTQPSETTAPEPSGTVEVLASGGTTKVKIPTAANDLAQDAYAAYFNPQAASSIATQDGKPFEAEGDNDAATVKDVMVSEVDESSVSFIGLVDADGESGPQSSAYRSVTLVNEDDTWKVASY